MHHPLVWLRAHVAKLGAGVFVYISWHLHLGSQSSFSGSSAQPCTPADLRNIYTITTDDCPFSQHIPLYFGGRSLTCSPIQQHQQTDKGNLWDCWIHSTTRSGGSCFSMASSIYIYIYVRQPAARGHRAFTDLSAARVRGR